MTEPTNDEAKSKRKRKGGAPRARPTTAAKTATKLEREAAPPGPVAESGAPARKGRGRRRRRRRKPSGDPPEIVLLCNPRAGGRWKDLAEILDSDEARSVRRIVTDSVDDVGPALSVLGRESELLLIYGGDGTIQRILDRISPSKRDEIRLALIGGGTMNVTARWCGMSGSPVDNFRAVMRAYSTGQLLLKELPLLEVRQGKTVRRGFTFGMGPLVRLLDVYERGRKGKLAAIGVVARTLASVWTGRPAALRPLVEPMAAEVLLDGERIDQERYIALFANTTGQINPGVEPFTQQRTRESFYAAAYSVSPREFTLAMPLLLRGWMPVDPVAMLHPLSLQERAVKLFSERRLELARDQRYVNRPASRYEIRTEETLYTIDGELLQAEPGVPIEIRLGPTLQLAVSPMVALEPAVRFAASRAINL